MRRPNSLELWVEGWLGALEIWLQIGLASGAGIAAAFGRWLLAVLLIVLVAGLFLRMWRIKRRLPRA